MASFSELREFDSLQENSKAVPKKTKRPGHPAQAHRFADKCNTIDKPSVNVVLLPVEGGVGLDDDVFVSGLLEFVHEHGLAGFESLCDFGMNTEG